MPEGVRTFWQAFGIRIFFHRFWGLPRCAQPVAKHVGFGFQFGETLVAKSSTKHTLGTYLLAWSLAGHALRQAAEIQDPQGHPGSRAYTPVRVLRMNLGPHSCQLGPDSRQQEAAAVSRRQQQAARSFSKHPGTRHWRIRSCKDTAFKSTQLA